MIHIHKLIGLALIFTGLGILAASICFWRVANILQDIFDLIEELKMTPKITIPKSFIQDKLSTWLVETALNRLEEIEAPKDITDLIILYSWAFVNCSEPQPETDNWPELVSESLTALEKSGWQH